MSIKILLFGAGAVGGYFGGKLSRVADVTFIARGRRLEVLKERGLILRNAADFTEERLRINVSEKPEDFYDFILIAVKSKDTHEAARVCREHLKLDGAVLSLQNGADNIKILSEYFGEDRVIGGVVTSGNSTPEDGTVLYEPYPALKAGALTEKGKVFYPVLTELFEGSGVRFRLSDDIRRDIWTKAVWNIAYNPLSALTGATCGELVKGANSRKIMESLIGEAVSAAKADGVILPPDICERTISLNSVFANYKTSSLQDVEANRLPETDGILGPVLRLAAETSPVTETLYNLSEFRFKEKWFHSFPRLAADVLLVSKGKVLLVERKHEPLGWAIPGGMAELGETIEKTACRELEEETGVLVTPPEITLLGVYSDPKRDSRGHTISVVYYAYKDGVPVANDDAADARFFGFDELPQLAFDHAKILADFMALKK